MKSLLIGTTAIILTTATPALAQDTGTVVADAEQAAQEAAEDAETLALAEAALDLYWPKGNTEAAVDFMLGPWADRMLDSPIRDLAEPFRPVIALYVNEMGPLMEALASLEDDFPGDNEDSAEADGEEADGNEELEAVQELFGDPEDIDAGIDLMLALYGDLTIRGLISDEDEHFDERLSILRDVMDKELPAVLEEFEEPVRAGLVQVFADRFTKAELAQIAAFADTPAGEKFAANIFTVGFEPEYFAGIMASFPGMIKKAPPLVEALEERMAHLPPMFPEPEASEAEEAYEACAQIEDEAERETCQTEAQAAMEDEWQPTPEELDEWAAEYQAMADDYRQQAKDRRAELAAEAAPE